MKPIYKYIVIITFSIGILNLFSINLISKNTEKKINANPINSIENINNTIKNADVQKAMKQKNIGIIIAEIAKSFINYPYLGGTLDELYKLDTEHKENLIYRLDNFDCVTLCETAFAIARNIINNKNVVEIDLRKFEKELTNIRYKNGEIKNYASRLHYTSEWIIDNEKRGNLYDISKEIKAKKLLNKVFFMSKNYKYYPALVNDNTLLDLIIENENLINSTDKYYIPNSEISKHLNKIKTGDFIAIVTNKAGLDYSHIGIAYLKENNKVHFLHASSNKKKVVLDDEISNYLRKNKSAIGISILRPL